MPAATQNRTRSSGLRPSVHPTAKLAAALASLMILAVGSAAGAEVATSAAPLAGGEYDCAVPNGMGVLPLGRMDIRGGSYRFRPLGKVTQGFAAYSVGAGGVLHWSGGVGGLTQTPSVILESAKTTYGFRIKYRASPGGFAESMTCRHMG